MTVVGGLAVRDDDVQGVGRAAEEDDHQHIPAWPLLRRRERQPGHPPRPRCMQGGERRQRDRGQRFQEASSGYRRRHRKPSYLH